MVLNPLASGLMQVITGAGAGAGAGADVERERVDDVERERDAIIINPFTK